MIIEILVTIIVVVSMLSILGCSYGIQREKYHRRHKEWMAKTKKGNNDGK